MNLHKEFVSLNYEIISMKNRLIFLLLQIYEQEIYKKHGCSTIYEYAFKYAKLSKERVQKALRTLRNTENTPEVRAKIETCGLDKVALVAKLATPENQHSYAAHVENMSTATLQAFTKEIRNGSPVAPKMTIELDEEMQILFNQLKKKHGINMSNQQALKVILKSVFEDAFPGRTKSDLIKKGDSVSEDAFSKSVQVDVAKKGQTVSEDAPSFPSRAIPARTKQEIQQKTNGKCAYPHCTKPIETHHHAIPFAFRRSHEDAVGLCEIHHEFCHNGVVRNELKDPENWKLNIKPHKSIYDGFYGNYKMKPR